MIHLQVAHITNGTMMRPIGFDVLTLLTKSHAVVYCAVENWQVGREVLQKSRLLVWIFDLEQLIEL